MQWIARHGAGVGEARHHFAGPIEERTELEEATAGVGGDEDHLATIGRPSVEPSPRANESETALLARYPAMLLVPASTY